MAPSPEIEPEPIEPEPTEPDDDPESVDDWTPPTREEWEAHQAKLKTASGEAAARRKFLRAAGLDPKTGNKLNPDPEPDPVDDPTDRKDDAPRGPSQAEIRRQIEKATTEAELRGRRQTRALVTGVNAALAESGWNGQRLGSLMKLLDLDEVDIDEDGEVTGLTEQIDDIKREWPEFFKRTRNPAGTSNSGGSSGQNGTPAAKVDTADKKPPEPEPKDWAERLARQALRGS
ncbi:phage scaffolding protein [Streptomyces turgidiscabies]|uniref:phage scaffolding protein n=1 Tax=Streptomyces turgidiscabies TaxID=85558 RepID=UPI0038F6A28B